MASLKRYGFVSPIMIAKANTDGASTTIGAPNSGATHFVALDYSCKIIHISVCGFSPDGEFSEKIILKHNGIVINEFDMAGGFSEADRTRFFKVFPSAEIDLPFKEKGQASGQVLIERETSGATGMRCFISGLVVAE